MTRLVVDAGVAVKWFLPEVHSEAAERLLDPANELLAPDLLWAEITNVLWKHRRRREIALGDAHTVLARLRRFPLRYFAIEPLSDAALTVAERLGCTVYDGLYVALADRAGCSLVTADRRLFDVARGGPFARTMTWIADLR